ncbi:MAG: Sir2 family NAD-dependent protein deacetylase, partial [Nanoarchaeota archaeon]
MINQLEEATRILDNSNRVLFLTGSGMSADSGIPTFKDEGSNKDSFVNGKSFRSYPEKCWGNYELKRRIANNSEPHLGYDVINQILEEKESFVITTNIDGYHLRTGIPGDKILETHGSLWRLQRLDGLEEYVEENYQVPLCDLDEKAMTVSHESMPRYKGQILRPNVFMSADSYFIGNNYQIQNWQRFQENKIDTVLLIGSGNEIPKNINKAKLLQRRGSKVICLNPSIDECKPILAPDVYLQMTARE